MRLTLRTLLAYLDDILDPADKEELAKKIESSEFAEDLVHRTRDTARRLRLSAPQVIGTGVGLDPNSVAEYLDNVMPPDAVGDYERICLESDVHLAEAAACHHVLTMVLGEPAEVDPRARQRMYTIALEAGERKRLRMEPPHLPVAAMPPVAAAVPASATTSIAHQPTAAIEIPEYLRTGAWWQSRAVFAALAAVVIIGIGILLVSGLSGWFGSEPALGGLSAETIQDAISPPGASAPADQAARDVRSDVEATGTGELGAPPQPLTPGIAPPPAAATEPPDPYAIDEGGQDESAETPAVSATSPTDAPVADPIPTANAGSAEPPPTGTETANIPPQGIDGPNSADATLPTANVAPPGDTADASIPPADPSIVPADPSVLPASSPPAAPADDEAASIPGDAAADVSVSSAPAELGTYMGGKTVMLRHDVATGSWFRVEPRAAVNTGERLLALPEFRPKITLLSGLHLDMSGGTQIVFGAAGDNAAGGLPPSAADVPAVEIVYGRIVLFNPTNAENQVRLKVGASVAEARLGRSATLAIEVQRKHVPGQDPRQAPAPVEARAFAPDGGVVWQDAAGTTTIDNASSWTIAESVALEVVADNSRPEWLDNEPIVQLSEQRYGAPLVESTLVSNRPVDIQLLELFQGSRRKEVKSLVARSSIHVGVFEPFVDALRDSEQKANWKTHVETLRAAMALSPESAANVKRTLDAQRGKPAADDLYEMLCGYNIDQVGRTPDQMKTGVVPRLINWLEEESLDYRVLAVEALKEITGRKLMSNPAAGLAERTKNVRVWRARLEAGDLLPPPTTP